MISLYLKLKSSDISLFENEIISFDFTEKISLMHRKLQKK